MSESSRCAGVEEALDPPRLRTPAGRSATCMPTPREALVKLCTLPLLAGERVPRLGGWRPAARMKSVMARLEESRPGADAIGGARGACRVEWCRIRRMWIPDQRERIPVWVRVVWAVDGEQWMHVHVSR